MIGYYNYSVILTYVGLGSAVLGMVQAMEGNLRIAILCLMVCGFCDMFDGAIARTCKPVSYTHLASSTRPYNPLLSHKKNLPCGGFFLSQYLPRERGLFLWERGAE